MPAVRWFEFVITEEVSCAAAIATFEAIEQENLLENARSMGKYLKSKLETLKKKFSCPIGYSGHETGIQTTCAAVALGANFIERHITLDRNMCNADHPVSLEPKTFKHLVKDIKTIEKALGDGVKKVYNSELKNIKKLRQQKDIQNKEIVKSKRI